MIYQPQEDSFLLTKQVAKFSKGKKVLEIGSGSGIQLETALKNKASSARGVDIDAESVEYCKSKKLNVIKSSLFTKIKKQKFDLIIFNPPYLPEDKREDSKSSRATTGGKKGDEIILHFLKKAPSYLEKNGIILLVVSSLTPQKRINSLLKKEKLKKKILSTKKFFMERLEVWEIKSSSN